MVGLGGLEPPTSRLSGAHSNQLSYKPKYVINYDDENKRIYQIPLIKCYLA